MTTPGIALTAGTTITVPVTGASANPCLPLGYQDPVRAEIMARTGSPDYHRWLHHVHAAAGCTHPIRLYGEIDAIDTRTGQLLSRIGTDTMPDGVIYKPCGNRRESVCPSCSEVYKRDAYQLIKAGLAGGKGMPSTVARHPAVFPTLTAPSFGPVHNRVIDKHTCTNRRLCDCRAKPCTPRDTNHRCEHGQPMMCFARHDQADTRIGKPLCLDCYDHDHQVVWNHYAGELWRRTRITIERQLRHIAAQRGIDPATVKLAYGKVAEMQRRAVVHFHAIVRLDGRHPDNATAILQPPAGLDAEDLRDAIAAAAHAVAFHTRPHPNKPDGWLIRWGPQLQTRLVTVAANGDITDGMVAAYLAKYATKATEDTGHMSRKLTEDTVNVYADPDGTHTERLVDACWMLGNPREWRGLRSWAHMLGFGGHFFTKSRTYTATFRFVRQQRADWTRSQTTGPETDAVTEEPTVLVVNFLQFVGAGWHTTGDAILANTSAAMAREQRRVAREEMAAMAAASM